MKRTNVSRPSVLFVAPELPHAPLTGAHTRPLSIIRALTPDYDVAVVGAAPSGADLSALEATGAQVIPLAMTPYARSVSRAALSRTGGSSRRSRSSAAGTPRSWGGLSERPRAGPAHVLHLVSMYSCGYRDERLPAVIDLLDVVSGLCDAAVAAHPLRYGLARIQRRSSEALERRELAKMRAVIAINVGDASRLGRLGVKATVVPLAVAVPSAAEPTGQPATSPGHALTGLSAAAAPSGRRAAPAQPALRGQLPAPSQPGFRGVPRA